MLSQHNRRRTDRQRSISNLWLRDSLPVSQQTPRLFIETCLLTQGKNHDLSWHKSLLITKDYKCFIIQTETNTWWEEGCKLVSLTSLPASTHASTLVWRWTSTRQTVRVGSTRWPPPVESFTLNWTVLTTAVLTVKVSIRQTRTRLTVNTAFDIINVLIHLPATIRRSQSRPKRVDI